MALDARMAALKDEIHNHRHHCLSWHQLHRFEELLELLADELAPWQAYFIPASARFAAYLKGTVMTGTAFPSGSTIDLLGDVKNAGGVDIPNPVTWTADQGTLSVDPANPENATLTGVPDGQVTVTMTTTPGADGNPIVVQHTYTLADLTPATADFTATAA